MKVELISPTVLDGDRPRAVVDRANHRLRRPPDHELAWPGRSQDHPDGCTRHQCVEPKSRVKVSG